MKKLLLWILTFTLFVATFGLIACGTNEDSDEKNFDYWATGIAASANVDDEYTYTYFGLITETSGGEVYNYESNGKEARKGNKFYATTNEYELSEDGEKHDSLKEIYAIKVVDDNGKTRTKRYEYAHDFNEEWGEEYAHGYYVAPDNAAERIEFSPSQILADYGIKAATTYEKACAAFTDLWYGDNEERNDTITFSLMKNTDNGAISFVAKAEYNTQDTDGEGSAYTVKGNDSYEFVVEHGKFTKLISRRECTYAYPDETKNYSESRDETISFTYGEFDEAYYDSIDVTTETTYHEYTSYVNYYVNGYLYNVSMSVPVGDSVTTEEIKRHFVKWDENCNYNTLIGRENFDDEIYDDVSDEQKAEWIKESKAENAKIMSAMTVYADAEMTVPFESLTVKEYQGEYNVYVKLAPPTDDAWVISVIASESENSQGVMFIRFIQGCASKSDGTLTFNSNQRLSSFSVISVDGDEPSEDGIYTFEGGTVHIFICEKNY